MSLEKLKEIYKDNKVFILGEEIQIDLTEENTSWYSIEEWFQPCTGGELKNAYSRIPLLVSIIKGLIKQVKENKPIIPESSEQDVVMVDNQSAFKIENDWTPAKSRKNRKKVKSGLSFSSVPKPESNNPKQKSKSFDRQTPVNKKSTKKFNTSLNNNNKNCNSFGYVWPRFRTFYLKPMANQEINNKILKEVVDGICAKGYMVENYIPCGNTIKIALEGNSLLPEKLALSNGEWISWNRISARKSLVISKLSKDLLTKDLNILIAEAIRNQGILLEETLTVKRLSRYVNDKRIYSNSVRVFGIPDNGMIHLIRKGWIGLECRPYPVRFYTLN